MANIIITIIHKPTKSRWDVSLPGDVPLGLFLPQMINMKIGNNLLIDNSWSLRSQDTGEILDPDSTLNEISTLTGDILFIQAISTNTPKFSKKPTEIKGACLITPDGDAFPIIEKFTLIGRSPKAVGASISLAPYDKDDRCSRQHAEIKHTDREFWIRDTKSKHGTFVNDEKLSSGYRQLKSGDLICFGEGGPVLKFQVND
jgi:hypothetical protein